MNGRRIFTTIMALCLVGAISLAGCNCPPKDEAPPPPPKKDSPKPAPAPKPVGACAVMSIPTAAKDATGNHVGNLVLERYAPAEVAVGQVYEYSIRLTNSGEVGLRDVVVTDEFATGWKFDSSDPAAASTEGGKGVFNVGKMMPGETKTIKVKGSASGAGQLVFCASVTFHPFVCCATNVIQPALKLTKTATPEVLICDPIVVKFVVTNSGTGTAKNVKIEDTLPAGLTTDTGANKVSIPVGDLAGGQSKEASVTLKAAKTGKYTNNASATADGGLKADASASTTVKEPVLTITKTGPEQAFVGRTVTYEITVSNTGDAPAANATVVDAIGTGVAFVSATEGGKFDKGNVTWALDTLAPGASKKLSVTVKPAAQGEICNTATASAKCAKPVTAKACSKIVGIPAILLEVVDADDGVDFDPIQVGQDGVYVITVTNQGSEAGKNVKITLTLEAEAQFISADGATQGTHADGKVTFEPLPSLAAKGKAIWKVKFKAVKAGDTRVKVSMTEERLTRPVEETEATNFYK